eukprot:COSAG01_NODE_20262_length_963_cov_0.653935_1_plen_192_part_00
MQQTEGVQGGGGSLRNNKPGSAGWWGAVLFWLARLCKLVFVALAISNAGRVWRVAEPTFEVEVKDKTRICHVDFETLMTRGIAPDACKWHPDDGARPPDVNKSPATFRYPLYNCELPLHLYDDVDGDTTLNELAQKSNRKRRQVTCSLAWFLVAATWAGNFFAVVAVLIFVTVDFLSRRAEWEARCTRSMV